MNNLDKIFKLIDAGYTKEEINELLRSIEPAETAEPEEALVEAPEEEPKEPTIISKPTLNPDIISKLGDAIKGLDDKINKLDKSIKAGNILNSSMEVKPTETAEDILASLITPKLKDK